MSTTAPIGDAYALLSKPTLELTPEEIKAICADLRQRRERFLAGQKDNQPKPAKKAVVPMTDEAKQQASAEILNDIGNLF
jgi:hypothetical protein